MYVWIEFGRIMDIGPNLGIKNIKEENHTEGIGILNQTLPRPEKEMAIQL